MFNKLTVVSIALMLGMVLVLAGCSSGSSAGSAFVGTWVCSNIFLSKVVIKKAPKAGYLVTTFNEEDGIERHFTYKKGTLTNSAWELFISDRETEQPVLKGFGTPCYKKS